MCHIETLRGITPTLRLLSSMAPVSVVAHDNWLLITVVFKIHMHKNANFRGKIINKANTVGCAISLVILSCLSLRMQENF